MKKRVIISISMSIICSYLQSATLIPGNASGNNLGVNSFNQAIVAKEFNPATGEFFVGLNNPAGSTPSGAFNISKFSPYQNYNGTATTVPIFQGISPAVTQGATIDFLSLANSLGNTAPLLGTVANNNTPGSLNQTQMFVQTSQILTGSIIATQSAVILGTNVNNPDANGQAIAGIAGLEGAVIPINVRNDRINKQRNYFFVPVFPQLLGGTPGFGTLNSGIAVMNAVLNITQFPTSPTMQINQVAAQPNQTGIKASLLDPTSTQIKISGDGTPFITLNRVSMVWDDQLQRLYTGLQVATNAAGTGAAGDGAASVVLGRVDLNTQGSLTFENFFPAAALQQTAGSDVNIVGVKQQAANTPLSVSAAQLGVMHASTGPSYLIGWGGNGVITTNPNDAIGTVGNLIWAVPLVDKNDITDPDQGLLAAKNDPLVDHRFVVPVQINADLPTNFDEFAQVGGGPLPVQPSTPVSGIGSGSSDSNGARDTLDVVVSGDTVYVAIATPQTNIDDAGVFYSQAMFDQTGKIIRWTPWAKRAFPFNAFSNFIPQNTGNVRFVSVNSVTGNVVAVDGTLGQTALTTSWNYPQNASYLPLLISQALCEGSYSVLDLDQSLSVLSEPGPSRYTLFGGSSTVVFARTSISRSEAAPFNETPPPATVPNQIVPAPQKPATYFQQVDGNVLDQGCICPNQYIENVCQPCLPPIPVTGTALKYDPENFLVTSLPTGAGAIKALEYSKQAKGTDALPVNTNYFFAGSSAGLFAFAQAGVGGFDARILGEPDLGALDKPPFSSGQWVQVPAIKGSVIDIKSSGLTLYVMTVQLPYPLNLPTVYSVYRINYADTLAAMFGGGTIFQIAQTNNTALGATRAFYGMQIINMTSNNGIPASEQLVLATNNGLYMSTRVGGVQNSMDTGDSGWTLIEESANTFYCGINGMDTILPTTVWPYSLGPLNRPNIYNRARIWQLNGGTTTDMGMSPNPYEFVPENFNANVLTGFNQPFASFNPITYFMSDGSRRFFITQSSQSGRNSTTLQVSPYNVVLNRVLSPTSIFDSTLQYVNNYNWVKLIGATGILMAGTNSGVVALE